MPAIKLSCDSGRAIADMRQRMGLSARGLARQLDVSPSTVVRWERDGAPVLAVLAVRALWSEVRKAAA